MKLLQIGTGAILILALDLLTKSWAQNSLQEAPLSPFSWFKLTYGENPGIAFGLPFEGILLVVATIVLIVVFTVYMARTLDLNNVSVRILLSLVLGGALGNLYDRILYGAVRDFIGIGPWPLFNLADSAIVVGIALLIIHLFRRPNNLPSNDSKQP